MDAILLVRLEIGSFPLANAEFGVLQPLPISALASALAFAPPELHRVMLGEQLYPLVGALERDHVGKVTGMLLEMDQTEVLHLIESPEALKAKVAETMEVLRMAQAIPSVPIVQLGNISISDSAD